MCTKIDTMATVCSDDEGSLYLLVKIKKRDAAKVSARDVLETEWIKYIDPNSCVAYFYNPHTGETTWDTPSTFVTHDSVLNFECGENEKDSLREHRGEEEEIIHVTAAILTAQEAKNSIGRKNGVIVSQNKSTSIELTSSKDSVPSSIPVDSKADQSTNGGSKREDLDEREQETNNGEWEVHRGRKRRNRRRNNTIQLKSGMIFEDATIKLVAEFGALVDFECKSSDKTTKNYTGLIPAWVIRKWAEKNVSISNEDMGIHEIISIGDVVDVIITGVKMMKGRNGKQRERVRLDILQFKKD